MPSLTLLALHTNGGSGFHFSRVASYLPEHVKFRAITLSGFGNAVRNPTIRTLKDYAASLTSYIAMEQRPIVLLGHGTGGSVALEYAQKSSSELDGLILHTPIGARQNSSLAMRLIRLRGMKRMSQELLGRRFLLPLWKSTLFRAPVSDETAWRFCEDYYRCNVLGLMWSLITPQWFAGLKSMPLKAALLYGAREISEGQISDYRTLFKQVTVRAMPRWGTFPMLDQPEAYAKEIMALAQTLLE